jgi:predicted PurR-regulated permease PerM
MEEQFIHQNKIRQIFFLAAIVLWGVMLALQLYSFVPALLGAITLYIISRKWMLYLVDIRKWKKSLAAMLLMFLSLLIILFPIGVLIQMMSSKVAYVIEHSNELVSALKIVIGNIEQRLGVAIVNPDNINNLSSFIAQAVPKVLNATFNTLVTIFFMYFILYFMLVNGRSMERGIYEYIPLKDENVDKLGREMQNIVISNAIGIPVIAFLQGVVAVIGYYIIGVESPWFWFVVTCFTAMLPIVGAALAYVPLAIIFFANDQVFQGVFMLIYGFGVIGTVDNIFRFTLARKIGNIHPLITVFGVIIGLTLFGFVGLIFGPVLISVFILLLKIYSNEFMIKKEELILKK